MGVPKNCVVSDMPFSQILRLSGSTWQFLEVMGVPEILWVIYRNSLETIGDPGAFSDTLECFSKLLRVSRLYFVFVGVIGSL